MGEVGRRGDARARKSENYGKSRWPPSLDMTKKLPAMHMRDVEREGKRERQKRHREVEK